MKIKDIILILVVVCIAVCFGILGIKIFNKKDVQVIEVIDSIKGYNYVLEDRDNEIYKNEFISLKNNLENNINYEQYAQSIAKLFIIDLYTLSNKLNKYDVGSVEFVYPETQDNYILKVKDTLYKYLKDNSYKDRNQVLPTVTSVNIEEVKELEYKVGEDIFPAYQIKASWLYDSENDFDSSGIIYIVRKDKNLYIVEKEDLEK